MGLIENGIGNFSPEIKSIIGELDGIFDRKPEQSVNSGNSQEKTNNSIPLSKNEIKAFTGLCSLEGTTTKDKMAELIKNYLEEKRNQMKK